MCDLIAGPSSSQLLTPGKPCDEGRPTCRRCEKAGQPCLGYRSPDQLLFRHHAVPVPPSPPTREQSSTELANKWFFEQYVVHSANAAVSPGFLNSLPSLLHSSEPTPHDVQPTEIVGWARLGKFVSGPTVEALVTAILLGLYEIISSSGDHPVPGHTAHVRWVCGLMLSPNSSFELLTSMELFQVANPLLIKGTLQNRPIPGVLCAPASNNTVHDLDTIIIQCHPFFERANNRLQDPTTLALVIIHQFSRWESHKDASLGLKVVGHISQGDADTSPCSFASPGPVHSYFDVYIAAVMNTYRKTYLLLLDVLIQLAPRSDFHNAQTLFEWGQDPGEYIAAIASRSRPPPLGRYVGGLLLLHPLYVLSTCLIVPPYYQKYARRCLAWIGEHMGIGQATAMAKRDNNILFQVMAEGHVLIWAGMLIQRSDDRT
ncbi:hypothetical protein BDV06DRAFT_214831 [Aspergillus oleicola]